MPAPLSTAQPHPSSTDHISTFRLYQALTQRIQALYRDCTAPPAGNGAGSVLRRPRNCRPAGRLRLRVCDGATLQADSSQTASLLLTRQPRRRSGHRLLPQASCPPLLRGRRGARRMGRARSRCTTSGASCCRACPVSRACCLLGWGLGAARCCPDCLVGCCVQ